MFRSTPSFRRSHIVGGSVPFSLSCSSSSLSSALLLLALLMLALGSTGCSMMSAGADGATEAARASKTTATATAEGIAQEAVQDASESAKAAAAKISFANGEANWIITEGLSRNGRNITFKEAQIDGNGWLVLHPFKDGRPNGAIHVGASYLRDGLNKDITVTVTQDAEPRAGEMFLVMLHSDVNEDQVFDFVFVDERNVLDRAVFEGMTMIAHIFPAP